MAAWLRWHQADLALYANNSIPAVLDSLALLGFTKPQTALIGRDENGCYKTAIAKEYPSNLCACFCTGHLEQDRPASAEERRPST